MWKHDGYHDEWDDAKRFQLKLSRNKRTEGNDRLPVVPLCSFCALLLYGFVSLVVSNLAINDWLAIIAGKEGLYLGFGIEGFAAEDDVGQDALLAIFL